MPPFDPKLTLTRSDGCPDVPAPAQKCWCDAVVADLGDAEKSKAWNEVYECLRQFEGVGGFATQFDFIIGVGARSSDA
jgi:hypothetical protein